MCMCSYVCRESACVCVCTCVCVCVYMNVCESMFAGAYACLHVCVCVHVCVCMCVCVYAVHARTWACDFF